MATAVFLMMVPIDYFCFYLSNAKSCGQISATETCARIISHVAYSRRVILIHRDNCESIMTRDFYFVAVVIYGAIM